MNEKRTNLVTILCWGALGFGALIIVIFLISLIAQKFSTGKTNETVKTHVEKEKENNEDQTQVVLQDNPNEQKSDTNKVVTVTTHMNYMNGYNDGTFLPGGGISRAEVATILARLNNKFDNSKLYYKGRYSDVAQDAWYANYIGFCDLQLIMQGYEDGTFDPNSKMNKRDFLAAIVRYVEVDYSGYTSKYSDVKGTWAEPYIGYLEAKGFVTGKTSDTLGATDLITRAEVCNVINNVLNRKPNKNKINATETKKYFSDVPQSAWYYYDVMEATTFHEIELYH